MEYKKKARFQPLHELGKIGGTALENPRSAYRRLTASLLKLDT